ncbi:anthranilate synthase component I [Microaerobacter geothermalis]|uniref:anthranilate synthase component I n=1 Tax=Microaerobacter geothermalis TaxID=674972 RepID=UPI001F289CEC|nr:anthranilate synthase component I [Microaerobacter geothermalis]MCF6093380.1 anthranilate synthase component I [Microaerobacter geothermalis]
MIVPHFNDLLQLSDKFNVIPMYKMIHADDETPISIYQKIRNNHSFLLESVEGGERWARYSIIGVKPFLRLTGKGYDLQIYNDKDEVTIETGNPVQYLKELLSTMKSPVFSELPPFFGGAVGYFGYDTITYVEKIPKIEHDPLELPDISFLFCDELIVYDHLKQRIFLICHLHVEPNDTEKQLKTKYQHTMGRISKLQDKISKGKSKGYLSMTGMDEINSLHAFKSNMTKNEFEEMVEKAKEYIKSGDIFQVVLSQRFHRKTQVDPFMVYRMLRTINPSPYMYYLQFEKEVLVGTSPEMLIRVENGKVETKPIAGTRPRGKSKEEDNRLKMDLLQDEKEAAEHHMLVDLGRNDVGRISSYGTVTVNQFKEVEYYSHVMHLVSHVTGELRPDITAYDALMSAFPAGTVSGAPKIRAMEIIAELEKEARGPYAGAIGYFGFNGNMDTCITIRTILFVNDQAYVQAGAGIVADSIPEKEYEETCNKAMALIKAIVTAEQCSYSDQEVI